MLLLGLALAEECSGARLPAGVGRMIAEDAETGALRRGVVAGLFTTGAREPRNDRVEPFRLRMRERRADRLRYVTRTWLTPRRHHIEMVALPGALRWAYFPLKWGLDFAVLPVWSLIRPSRQQS